MKKNALLLSLFLLPVLALLAQTPSEEKAHTNYKRAIDLMDNGNPDEAIKLLKEAKKLDPKNAYEYDYELGYAYAIKKDYANAIKVYEKVLKYPEVTDKAYQMLGNIYDMNGEPQKALATYDAGIKKFPHAGNLYLEKGMLYAIQKNYDQAIIYYEQGIEAAPDFSTNYYRAAQIYLSSKDKVWGMIYGEIYINMEPNNKRSIEISKSLYKAYQENIKITSDTSASSSFSSNTINITSKDVKDFKLPYGLMVYDPTVMIAVGMHTKGMAGKEVDLAFLNKVRTSFVNVFYQRKDLDKYPNILFEYQKKVLDAGHIEAYNYWVLTKGNSKGLSEWEINNAEKWEKFMDWFGKNPIVINAEHKTYRSMFE